MAAAEQDTAQRQHHREPRWRRGEPSLIECDIGRPRPQRAWTKNMRSAKAARRPRRAARRSGPSSGTTLPTPIATASAVSAVLHQASGRSLARHLLRRAARSVSGSLAIVDDLVLAGCSRKYRGPEGRALTPTRSLPREGSKVRGAFDRVLSDAVADPGIAPQDQRPAVAVAGIVEQLIEPGTLAFPANQHAHRV